MKQEGVSLISNAIRMRKTRHKKNPKQKLLWISININETKSNYLFLASLDSNSHK